jgi:predicted dehydrogenase
MRKRVIRWGIIGCGKIAHKFAHDLLLCGNTELIACASRDDHRAKAFAKEFGIPHAYGDYKLMLNLQELDIVYIATPHNLHYHHAQLCLQNGKHVLCEKPITINTYQLKVLIALAKKNQCFLMEAMWTAFLPMFQSLQNLLSTEIIGEIRWLKADFGFFKPFDDHSRLFNLDLAGGALLDIGIYPIFMAIALLGKPKTIQSQMIKTPTGSDASTQITLSYENGCIASLFCTLEANTTTECEIFGTKGSIKIPSRFHEQEYYTLTRFGQTPEEYFFKRIGYGYAHEILHINECLSNHISESPVMTHALSLEVMSIMDKIRTQNRLMYPGEYMPKGDD